MGTSNKTLDELLDEYRETFGHSFPSFIISIDGEEDWKQKIQKCLDYGKPANEVLFTFRDDVLY